MGTVWQIGCGDNGRYYDDLFLKYDVMFMGPGRFGKFNETVYADMVEQKELTKHKSNQIQSFTRDPEPDDTVLVRKGHLVAGIGVISDETYKHDERFDDIYGWNLQHTRRVIWQDHLSKNLCELQRDGKKPLFGHRKQIPTFTRVEDEIVLNPILDLQKEIQTRELKTFDLTIPSPLSLESLGEGLFSRGIANEAVDEVLRSIQRQRRLGKWYIKNEEHTRPSEHEVVAHMILPLFIALGWSEQQLALEWNKVDLAGFGRIPRSTESCVFICEAKHLRHGLRSAFDQVSRYHKRLKLENCNTLALTDGIRLYLYRKEKGEKWTENPSGYINIEKIRTDHIAPANTNAIDTLVALTPAGMFNKL